MFEITGALNDLQASLLGFLPELILCGTIVVMLLLRLFSTFDRWHMGLLALAAMLTALAVSGFQWRDTQDLPSLMFSRLLVYDPLTIYLRLFLFAFTSLVVWLTLLTGIPDREDSADFYCLLLGATVGMSLMASANHLLMVYIGVEMASLPSYALAGFLKGRRQSSEASLKYVVYGGGASGIMLYGISLLAGKFGTAYLPDLATGYATAGMEPILLLGTLFVLIGVGFKLAAVPFHFWCPDVFEGASAEVAGFLSVASKGAALALLARFVYVLAGLTHSNPDYATWLRAAQFFAPAIGFFAALTATFGNLAAYAQTNLKRLLAYSTIAHAGIMMMGLATLTREGASAVLYYLIAYLLMNLGAFAIVAFIRNQVGSEDLSHYAGLIHRAPVLVVTLSVFILSLLGLPPLAGFAAKFQIFAALYQAGQMYTAAGVPTLGYTMYALLVIGGLNTVLSVFYYIKVLKVAILDKAPESGDGRLVSPLRVPAGSIAFSVILSFLVLAAGIFFQPLIEASDQGVARFNKAVKITAIAERPSR